MIRLLVRGSCMTICERVCSHRWLMGTFWAFLNVPSLCSACRSLHVSIVHSERVAKKKAEKKIPLRLTLAQIWCLFSPHLLFLTSLPPIYSMILSIYNTYYMRDSFRDRDFSWDAQTYRLISSLAKGWVMFPLHMVGRRCHIDLFNTKQMAEAVLGAFGSC